MIDTLLKDPRRRNLAILAAAALVLVLLAVLAIHVKQGEVTPQYTEQSFFPDLVSHVREIATIRVASKRGTFDVTFKPYKGWVIPSRNDYPASYEQLKETMVGFAALLTIEPKTDRADWLHYVNLDAPPKGDGTQITLLDDKGRTIAAMIVGKSVDIGDPSGQVGLFVRKPDSDQSWLVKSPVEFKSDPADWMDKSVMDIDRARIAETDVDPIGTPPFDARRESQRDPDFAVTDVPAGRELADPGAADAVATAVAGFTFEDARPSKDFDFADAARLISRTFDGLTVTIETLKRDDGFWATVSAEAAPGKPEAAREAREINAHAAGWAYKLPAPEGQLFMTTLDSLLKPAGAAKPAPAP
jgi:hypothetical protein